VIPEDDTAQLRATADAIMKILFEQALIIPLYDFQGGSVMHTYVNDTEFARCQKGMNYEKAWMSNH